MIVLVFILSRYWFKSIIFYVEHGYPYGYPYAPTSGALEGPKEPAKKNNHEVEPSEIYAPARRAIIYEVEARNGYPIGYPYGCPFRPTKCGR